MIMENVGFILRKRRQELHITQQDLADLAGVGINTVVAIERNTGNPSVKTLGKLLDALGLVVSIQPRRI